MLRTFLSTTLALSLLAPGAAAAQSQGEDMLLLKDGRIFVDVELVTTPAGEVTVQFANGEVAVPSHLIEEALDLDAPPPEPKNDDERAKIAEGKMLYQGKWVTASKRDKMFRDEIEDRRKELKAIQDSQLWRNRSLEKTKHFEFEYTVPPHVFAIYRDQLEAYFKVFAKDWKVKPPKENPRLKICMYVTESDFLQIGGVPKGVLGYFRFVDPMELNFFYDRRDPVFTTEVLFHEANHYMQKLIDLEFKMPHFPGEAIAEYYGGAHWDIEKKKLTVGLVLPSRLVEVKTDIATGKYWGLEELVSADEAYQHYTWGWTLAHFLMKSKKHEKNFKKFVMALADDKKVKRDSVSIGAIPLKMVRGKEVWNTFRRYMKIESDEAVKELEKEWHSYIDNELKVEGVRAKEAAGVRAVKGWPRQEIRGKRLLTEAVEEGSINPIVYQTLGEMHFDDRDYSKAAELFEKAVSFDPLEPGYTFWHGMALKRIGQSEEGQQLIELAKEMGINDPSLRFLLELEDELDD